MGDGGNYPYLVKKGSKETPSSVQSPQSGLTTRHTWNAFRSSQLLVLLLLVGLAPALFSQQTKGGRYDQQIQADVEKVLKSKSKFQNVQATTEDGIVTLTGTVKIYRDKLDAALSRLPAFQALPKM